MSTTVKHLSAYIDILLEKIAELERKAESVQYLKDDVAYYERLASDRADQIEDLNVENRRLVSRLNELQGYGRSLTLSPANFPAHKYAYDPIKVENAARYLADSTLVQIELDHHHEYPNSFAFNARVDKIPLIKFIRDKFEIGLKEAKDVVDKFYVDLDEAEHVAANLIMQMSTQQQIELDPIVEPVIKED